MIQLHSRHLVGLLVVSTALAAACNGSSDADAGDASDVLRTDVVSTSDGSDVQADVPTDDGTNVLDGAEPFDAAPDATPDATGDTSPADGGMCAPVVSPLYSFGLVQMALFSNFDLSGVGGMNSAFFFQGGLRTAPDTVPSDGVLDGDCFYSETQNGTMARYMSSTRNYGRLTVAQGSQQLVYDFDTAMGRYVKNAPMSSLNLFTENMAATFDIMGGDGGVGGMSTLVFPPRPTTGAFNVPTMLSRTATTDVTWTVPSGDTSDLYVEVGGSDTDGNKDWTCFAPACRGVLHIPSSMIHPYNAGDEVDTQFAFVRFTSVPPTSRTPALTYELQNIVAGVSAAQ